MTWESVAQLQEFADPEVDPGHSTVSELARLAGVGGSDGCNAGMLLLVFDIHHTKTTKIN
jgi:hypothetical protein